MHDEATRAAIERVGGKPVVGAFKIRIDAKGLVATVDVLESTGFPAYDQAIDREMKAWTFEPFAADGKAAPMCTAVTIRYPAAGNEPRP